MFSVQIVGLLTIVTKEVTRIFRIWTQTLLPSVITISLYYLIFGTFIGDRIGTFMNVPYMQFIVPGLIMLAILTNSFSNVAATFFSAKFQKNIEELLVSPLSPLCILLGFISGGVLRGLLVGILVTGVSLFFVPLQIYNLPLLLTTGILTALLFALFGLFNGIFARRFDDIAIIPTFIITPLTYLGGVFYSIEVLPPFWQTISLLNPILYLVNLLRYSFLGMSDIPVMTALAVLFAFVLIFFCLCYTMIKKGIRIKS
eukprot:COSAG01_NODE_93_length_27013_cov_41.515791_7_plen_257_part_00